MTALFRGRVFFAACLLIAGGCQRTSAPVAAVDYRTLNKQQIIDMIQKRLAYTDVTLTEKGTNNYVGTVKSPDGTATLPLTVSVEAERIVCDIKTPAGSMRKPAVISPSGVDPGELNIK